MAETQQKLAYHTFEELSNYGKYIQERENKYIVEDSNGFATFSYLENSVYIEEIYVIPEKRKENIASSYADKIAKLAKQNGYDKLLGSVDPKANKATISLKVLLGYGFSLLDMDQNLIYFIKEI